MHSGRGHQRCCPQKAQVSFRKSFDATPRASGKRLTDRENRCALRRTTENRGTRGGAKIAHFRGPPTGRNPARIESFSADPEGTWGLTVVL